MYFFQKINKTVFVLVAGALCMAGCKKGDTIDYEFLHQKWRLQHVYLYTVNTFDPVDTTKAWENDFWNFTNPSQVIMETILTSGFTETVPYIIQEENDSLILVTAPPAQEFRALILKLDVNELKFRRRVSSGNYNIYQEYRFVPF